MSLPIISKLLLSTESCQNKEQPFRTVYISATLAEVN